MSSKGKKDKGGAAAAAPELPPEKEVIPGKVTETLWLEWMREEEASEVAGEIVRGLVDLAYYLGQDQRLEEEEAFSFAVQTAKASLLQIIEWEFLQRDEGEEDPTSNPTWTEDPEPQCSVIDSWARGIVPETSEEEEEEQRELSPSQCSIEDPPLQQPDEDSLEYTGDMSGYTSLPLREQERRPTRESTVSSSTYTTTTTSRRHPATTPPMKVTRARPQARRPQARLLALTKPQIEDDPVITSHNIEQVPPSPARSHTPTTSPLPPSSPHPPPPLPYNMKPAQLRWQKDVTYDSSGKIIDMMRLNPSSFPLHRVRPRVTISNPSPHKMSRKHETQPRSQQHPSSLRHNENIRTTGNQTGKRELATVRRVRGREGREPGSTGGGRGGVNNAGSKGTVKGMTSNRFPETLTLPPLVDTIDLSAGVSIREGDRRAVGPQSPRRPPHFLLPNTAMHPVTLPPPSSLASPPSLSAVSGGHMT